MTFQDPLNVLATKLPCCQITCHLVNMLPPWTGEEKRGELPISILSSVVMLSWVLVLTSFHICLSSPTWLCSKCHFHVSFCTLKSQHRNVLLLAKQLCSVILLLLSNQWQVCTHTCTHAHTHTHTHTHTLIHLTAYNKVWKEWGPRLAWATYFSTLNLAFSNSFFSPNNQGSFRKPLTKRLKPLRKTSNFLLYLPTSKHWKTNLHITETNPEAKLVATTFTVLFSLEVEKFSF